MNIWAGDPSFTAGDVRYPPGGTLGPRVQPNLQLVYLWSGEASIWINGARVLVRPGEGILLLPGRRERFAFAEHEQTHHGWCEVIRPVIEPALETQLRSLDGAVRPLPARLPELARTAMILKNDLRWGVRRAYYELCAAIIHLFAAEAGIAGPHASAGTRLPPPLARALEEIHANLAEVGSIGALAESVGLSHQHLVRLFSRHLGEGPAAYLWRARTSRAVELIQATGLSFSQIADQCGFKTQFHLSRRVHEATGSSPTQLRAQLADSP